MEDKNMGDDATAGILSPTESEVLEALRTVIDPEIGVNVVDLGMISSIRITGGEVRIGLTPTNPLCPLGDVLVQGMQVAVESLNYVQECMVLLVFDPPWNPLKITEEGRRLLAKT